MSKTTSTSEKKSQKKQALGRGLGSLLGASLEEEKVESKEIPVKTEPSKVTEKVKFQIVSLQEEKGINLTPPIKLDYCQDMVDKLFLPENFGQINGFLVAK